MLDRDIEVFDNFILACEEIQKTLPDILGIDIEEPDPFGPFHSNQTVEKGQ